MVVIATRTLAEPRGILGNMCLFYQSVLKCFDLLCSVHFNMPSFQMSFLSMDYDPSWKHTHLQFPVQPHTRIHPGSIHARLK